MAGLRPPVLGGQWTAITGEVPPPTPVDRDAYVAAGLPWFDYYDADHADVAASEMLASVKAVGEFLGKEGPFMPVGPTSVVTLKDHGGTTVGPGTW